jgi:transglutaminase-like putative cysteine protease
MTKYLKKLGWILLLVGAALGSVGYYYGLRWDNYQAFISSIFSKSSNEEDIPIEPKNAKSKPSKRTNTPRDNNQDDLTPDLQPAPKNPYFSIDKYARNCPKTAQESIESLSNYLKTDTKSDLERARAIFVWLTENINYDDESYNSGGNGDNSAEAVLSTKIAFCEGFSNLFLALGRNMGLEIEKVHGYAKGYGDTPGMKFRDTDHAWNIIKINGVWRVFDATWGQGSGETVNGKLRSKKEFKEYWFNVDPFEAIFSHFPQDRKYAFVQPMLSLSGFEKFPSIDVAYFEMGFDGKQTYQEAFAEMGAKFPECFKLGTYIRMHEAPKREGLLLNKAYTFDFFIPRAYSVAMIDAENNWTYFEREKGRFKLEYTPKTEGPLQISVQSEKGGNTYSTMLIYKVAK